LSLGRKKAKSRAKSSVTKRNAKRGRKLFLFIIFFLGARISKNILNK